MPSAYLKRKSAQRKSPKQKFAKQKSPRLKSNKKRSAKRKSPKKGGFDRTRVRFPRKMSKKYCISTPCKKMGFSQRASCRYYKNC
jgi:hypothetical protein